MRTAYIVGAGASTDFGLPAGPKLQEMIAEFISPENTQGHDCNPELERIASKLEDLNLPYQDQYNMCSWFSRTLPLANSIDNFLETQSRPGDAISFIGKYAIATLISRSEKNSPLFVDRQKQVDFSAISQTWMGRLFPKINRGGGARIAEKGLQETSFITFNYDRCIEQFLYLAFKEYYRLSPQSAQDFVRNVNIHHVYGSLGDPFSGDGLGFGNDFFSNTRIESAHNIKTYSEELEHEQVQRLASLLAHAERIIFIGFAFLPINQRILTAAFKLIEARQGLKKVFGTSYKMSPADSQRATAWCDTAFRRGESGTILQPITGAEFFEQNALLFG